MNELYQILYNIFGLEPKQMNIWEMVVRAAFIYICALIIIRLGDKRFLGKNTVFDMILSVIIGSTFSRAINGTAPVSVTISAGITLIGLHWLFALISLYNKKFGNLVKGTTTKIVDQFTPNTQKMKKWLLTEDDIREQLRLGAKQKTLDGIEEAYLERSGEISFIKEKSRPQILDIKVENGVQIIRIKLE